MKGKGKIHPSPVPPAATGGEQNRDALAVLALLPVAILSLAAVLRDEDKEVLAYLLTRSIKGSVAASEERRPCRRPGGVRHRPVFDCGCFDCYTGFWSRWDCSPDREVIHQAIEVFEEHLASSEKKNGPGGRGRRKERKAAAERAEKEKEKKKEKEDKKAAKKTEKNDEEEAKRASELAMVEGAAGFAVEEAPLAAEALMATAVEEVEEEEGTEAEAITGERRRGWADVMEIFNSRLWGLWSPAHELV